MRNAPVSAERDEITHRRLSCSRSATMAAALAGMLLLAQALLVSHAPPCVRRAPSVRMATAAPPADAAVSGRKVMWEPDPEAVEKTAMRAFQRSVGVEGGYEELWKWSVDNSDEFWTRLLDHAELIYEGSTEPAKEGDKMPDVTYFPNVKINFAENMLRHGAPGSALADAEAIVSLSEARDDRRWTFAEARDDASRVRAALAALGVTSADACGAYLSNVGETILAMLGTTSLGATWTSCSPDFGAPAVADRFGQVRSSDCTYGPTSSHCSPSPSMAGGAQGAVCVRRLRLRGQAHLARRQGARARQRVAHAAAGRGRPHARGAAAVDRRARAVADDLVGGLSRVGLGRRRRRAAERVRARAVCAPAVCAGPSARTDPPSMRALGTSLPLLRRSLDALRGVLSSTRRARRGCPSRLRTARATPSSSTPRSSCCTPTCVRKTACSSTRRAVG
jgi:hypothetical protein